MACVGRQTGSTSAANSGCSVCSRIEAECTKHCLRRDIVTETVSDRSKRSECIGELLRHMNAFLNEGDGVLYIHCENLRLLNLFDEQVDDKLRNLIVDNTPFAANFRRYIVDDEHIAFEVLHRTRQGLPYSILKFHTKVSLNRGLGDPTQMEMKYYVTEGVSCPGAAAAETGGASNVVGTRQLGKRYNGSLKSREPALLGEYPLQESTSVQVKRVKDEVRERNGRQNPREHQPGQTFQVNPGLQALLAFLWKDMRLPQYISAFSKLADGGSVYFGVREEKQGNSWTGRVLYEGVQLSEAERTCIQQEFQRCVGGEMLWLAKSAPQNPIQVKFHDIEGGPPEMCVVEVVVSKLAGLAFFESAGPEAYRLMQGKLTKISISELVKRLGGSLKECETVFTHRTSE